MPKRTISPIIFFLLFVNILMFSSAVGSVNGSGTVYIRADGSIDPPTAPIQRNGDVYTLTGNITSDSDGIIVEKDNIVVEGSGFTIEGSGFWINGGSTDGVYLYERSNVTIQNSRIRNFGIGITLYTASYNNVLRNNVTDNNNGIWFAYSSDYNTADGNTITNSSCGIGFGDSSSNSIHGNVIANNSEGIWLAYVASNYNSISSNTVSNNSEGIIVDSAEGTNIWGNTITNNNNFGIVLHYSSTSNSISGNVIKDNGQGLGLYGSSSNNHIWQNTFIDDSLYVEYPSPNSVENNTVNGKPLVYLESVRDYSVKDAGQIILVRCNRISVENLNLSQTYTGLQLWQTNNCLLSGNNITTNRRCGIELFSCSNNSINGNTITNNGDGIWLDSSSNNSINGNTITKSNYEGIWLGSSSNNSINTNIIVNGSYGIWLNASTNNGITGNTITNNYVGLLLSYSSNSNIRKNKVSSNSEGVWLSHSSNNTMNGNTVTNNGDGIWLDSASSNTIDENNVSSNWAGMLLHDTSNSNSIEGNTISDNGWYGVGLDSSYDNSINGNTVKNTVSILLAYSSNNTVCRNNIVYSVRVDDMTPEYENSWDNGCEGNYWSNYNGTDLDNDGVGDTYLPWEGVDDYPLMNVYWNPCDISHDLKVDFKDIGPSAKAFETFPGETWWNPHADITGPDGIPDWKVDMRDVSLIAKHFGEHYS